jgi:tetratricopeptide (TPR) repeat protein
MTYNVVHLDELDRVSYLGSNLVPVRYTLDFRAAGVNAWAGEPGDQLVPPHEEDAGSEELYVVVRGRATFTVGDEMADAPAGTLVFAPPLVSRTAVAADPGTIVLAVGGIVGKPFAGGAWDSFAVADAYRRGGRLEKGRAVLQKAIDDRPERWAPRYNAACWEALAGNADAAFEHLRAALELNGADVREHMAQDTDLAALRDDPRWKELAA